jgi:type 1 glutamine amidotransferase
MRRSKARAERRIYAAERGGRRNLSCALHVRPKWILLDNWKEAAFNFAQSNCNRFMNTSSRHCLRYRIETTMKTILSTVVIACLLIAITSFAADTKKIVFIAGPPSHGPGEHEHRAGCLLLKSCLDPVPGVSSVVYSNGWPDNPSAAFADAAAVVVYSDGGGGHPLLQNDHLKTIGDLMNKGVGLVCLHYAVEPTMEKGEKEFIDWIGGCFEVNRSVNPTWTADFAQLPKHPIARGINPFKILDEWYFYMRFRDGMQGVAPILSAIPPQSTMNRPDGAHEGNPEVRAAVKRNEPQHMAWAAERANGGRGFGFTGGHYHKNWGNEDVRKLVLNAILWTAKVEVPADGVPSKVTSDELKQNLDPKGQRKR